MEAVGNTMGKRWWLGSLLSVLMAVPATAAPENSYADAMRIGYAATQQFDYQTALINFRRALALRPGDTYAAEAIANVEYYIERNELLAKQAEIDRLEAQLASAAQQRDWVCVTATVDQLIPFAEGLERERLTGYRSQLTGVLESQTDIDAWSTVCSPEGLLM